MHDLLLYTGFIVLSVAMLALIWRPNSGSATELSDICIYFLILSLLSNCEWLCERF